jgi:putative hydrolase of the HAD superfamily
MENIKILGFDADDTLWVNETYYRETESAFVRLLLDFASEKEIMERLYAMEIKNLPLYGYGAKGFVLSMTETALEVSNRKVPAFVIEKIIDLGKALLNKPVLLLDGVRKVLQQLKGRVPMILATKGDLLDQERKLKKSGLDTCFHHIEIMSDKKEANYRKLLMHLGVQPEEFMMVGNSLKSDVLPLLKLGAWGVHIPYHTTWVHEKTDEDPRRWKRFLSIEKLTDLLEFPVLKSS